MESTCRNVLTIEATCSSQVLSPVKASRSHPSRLLTTRGDRVGTKVEPWMDLEWNDSDRMENGEMTGQEREQSQAPTLELYYIYQALRPPLLFALTFLTTSTHLF